MKKISKITCVFLCVISLLLTGCDKTKENTFNQTGYYHSINYDTLVEASKSDEDSFFVLFYEDGLFNSVATANALKEYAETNKVAVYEFNVTSYLDEYVKTHQDEMEAAESEYVKNCMAIIDESETQEDVENAIEDGTEVDPIAENSEYDAETNTNIIKFVYTEQECKDSNESNFKYERKQEIYKEFNISHDGTIIFINKSFVLGTFQDFLPLSYPILEVEAKEAAEKQSKEDLDTWIQDILKEYK